MKKFFFHVSFGAQLVGLGGFFGKIIHDGIQNFQSSTVSGNVSKETIMTLGVLFFIGFAGFLMSNKLVDQLNKIENATKTT